MHKVEYLIINEKKQELCTSVETFNNLLKTNTDLKIDNEKLTYKHLEVGYTIQLGKIADTEKNFFHVTFQLNDPALIEAFSDLLGAVRDSTALIMTSPIILGDDISLYYSQKAYPIIFETENLMRQLITKFMLINAGLRWEKERTPEDVRKSINDKNKEPTVLYNVDFIQLSNFLFKEIPPDYKSASLQKIKKITTVDDVTLVDIKALLPVSNWEKYFADFLPVEEDSLKKKWEQLYILRCQVAHNKTFHQTDFQKVERLTQDLKPILQEAIANLATIEVSVADRETLAEVMGWINKKPTDFKNLSNDGREALQFSLGDTIFAIDRDLSAIEAEVDQLKVRKKVLKDELEGITPAEQNPATDSFTSARPPEITAELAAIESKIGHFTTYIATNQIRRDRYFSLFRELFGE